MYVCERERVGREAMYNSLCVCVRGGKRGEGKVSERGECRICGVRERSVCDV